jgi:hypothetical protein
MRRPVNHLHIATILVMLATASPSVAGQVTVFTRSQTVTQSGNGQVSASLFHPDEQGRGSAYEFNGGVGVSSAAQSVSRQPDPLALPSDNIPQVLATAHFADVFFTRAGASGTIGTGTFLLTIGVHAGGGVVTGQSPAPNGVPMSATAGYTYDYRLGSNIFRQGGLNQVNFEGTVTTTESGVGSGGTFNEQLLVNIGNFTTLALNAASFASASSYGLGSASATATFDHTLRWLGVSRIQYDAGGGNFVDAPEGFRLDLISDTTGFNYWNAAGPNPFIAAGGIPEPASWAMLIIGFGLTGTFMRRRTHRAVAA